MHVRATVFSKISTLSALPVPVSVLIVAQLELEEENPENDGDDGWGENPGHGGSDRLPVVRNHLLQEHAHLGSKVLQGLLTVRAQPGTFKSPKTKLSKNSKPPCLASGSPLLPCSLCSTPCCGNCRSLNWNDLTIFSRSVDWEIDEIGCEKFSQIWSGFSIPLRDIMETTKELLKLDALIGKNPFERTLPKVWACDCIYLHLFTKWSLIDFNLRKLLKRWVLFTGIHWVPGVPTDTHWVPYKGE